MRVILVWGWWGSVSLGCVLVFTALARLSMCKHGAMKLINKKYGTESCALARWPKIQWRLAMFPVGLIQCGIQSVAQPVRIICTGLGLPLPYFSLKYREREGERDCMNVWTDGVGVWLNSAPSNFLFQRTDSCKCTGFHYIVAWMFYLNAWGCISNRVLCFFVWPVGL